MSDPSLDPKMNRPYRDDSNAGMWAGILLAAFVIVMGLIFLLPKGPETTATAPGKSTTGAASQSAPPNNPAGSQRRTTGSATEPAR